MLVPPENYFMVEDGIYRCSKLDAINISFLKSLELKSIVWINEEKPPRVLQQFIEDHKIRLFHMMNSSVLPEEDEITNIKYQEWMVLKPSIISKSIEILLDINNQNCLIMDKSEVIVGIIRHIQRWNYASISNEYRLYTSRASYKVEIFLELINLELIPHTEDFYNEIKDKIDLNKNNNDNDNDNINNDDTINFDFKNIIKEKKKIDHIINEEDKSYFNANNLHSSTKAISIKRDNDANNSNDNNSNNNIITNKSPSYEQMSVSPVMRRLTLEQQNGIYNGTSLSPSSPLSSSMGKLSISTSPQIPKNLLKQVEMRKNKKRHLMEVKEQEEKKEASEISKLLQNNKSNNDLLINLKSTLPSSPLRKLSNSALDSYQLLSSAVENCKSNTNKELSTTNKRDKEINNNNRIPTSVDNSTTKPTLPSPPSPVSLSSSPTSTSSSTVTDVLLKTKNNSNISPPPGNQWKLYLPRKNAVHVSKPAHNGRTSRPLHTSITVQLPREKDLPLWFIELRSLCEEEG